tara:strand:+ start:136 stop:441 length:306 start_codon:yes stop_codon:yes gene_type:complete
MMEVKVGISQVEEMWVSENGVESFFIFEPNPRDGTKYTIHTRECHYGGVYAIVNENSLYRYHAPHDLKFLCGDDNKFTYHATKWAMWALYQSWREESREEE